MLNTIALIVVGIFAALMLVAGVAGVIRPDMLFAWVRKLLQSTGGVAAGVIARIVLGVALIFSAPGTALPGFCTVVGWIALAGALVLLLHRKRVVQLADALLSHSVLGRAAGLVSALVGGALLFAVIPSS